MAHIAIFVSGLALEEGDLKLLGEARVEGYGEPIYWTTVVAFNALAATINAACRDAAIAAAENLSLTVGALDKKTLYAAAVGL